jgi:hypothetical protein
VAETSDVSLLLCFVTPRRQGTRLPRKQTRRVRHDSPYIERLYDGASAKSSGIEAWLYLVRRSRRDMSVFGRICLLANW